MDRDLIGPSPGQSGENYGLNRVPEGEDLSLPGQRLGLLWDCSYNWADRTLDTCPSTISTNTSHTVQGDAIGQKDMLLYSFGRTNARIGISRSSSGISSRTLARARYLASNSRHRLTNRPDDKRGK